MAVDVSDRLGKPQLAGGFVVGKGYVKKRALAGAGMEVGGLIGGVISATGDYIGAKTAPKTETPSFKGLAYLAVSADEVVLFKARQGFRSPSVEEELARLSRSDIQSTEFSGGYLSHLTIVPRDGGAWEFEVQRAYKKSGIAIAEALGAAIS